MRYVVAMVFAVHRRFGSPSVFLSSPVADWVVAHQSFESSDDAENLHMLVFIGTNVARSDRRLAGGLDYRGRRAYEHAGGLIAAPLPLRSPEPISLIRRFAVRPYFAHLAVPPHPSSPMNDRVETIKVKAAEADMRLDRWFRIHFPDVGYSYLQKLLRTGQVRVDSKRAEGNERLEAGAQIRVPQVVRTEKPPAAPSVKPPLGLSKADRTAIERMILFEDDHVLVLNKPFGLAVQGGSGTKRHVDGMLAGMADRFGGERPRLVHRLDRDTTGVLLVAKHRDAAAKLGRVFQTRSAAKTYWALVKGVPKPPQGKVEAPLVKAAGPDGDRVRKALPGEQKEAMHATTHYSVVDRLANKASWVSLKPVTGRQHQLRAHMALIGNPIVGDNKYGGDENLPAEQIENKLHLHARRLVLPHPSPAARST